MKIKIHDEAFEKFHEETCEYKQGQILKKIVPDGWELVKPDDIVDEQCLVAYGHSISTSLISNISKSPVNYWSDSRNAGKIAEAGSRFIDIFPDDLWRLIRPAKQKVETKRVENKTKTEGDRLFEFFFDGMVPSDPQKLPAPPKVIGMSWDELAGE